MKRRVYWKNTHQVFNDDTSNSYQSQMPNYPFANKDACEVVISTGR